MSVTIGGKIYYEASHFYCLKAGFIVIILLVALLSCSKRSQASKPAEGLAPVKLGDRWGYIDKTGKLVINPQFDHAEEFSRVPE